MNEEQIKIENEFNVLFNGLSDREKMDISNHIFNMGLPEFPHFFHVQNGMRLGQHFINVLPVQLKESFPSIFYSNDSEFLKEQINLFVQKIFNDPIQNQARG
jgi:hypothetical protein